MENPLMSGDASPEDLAMLHAQFLAFVLAREDLQARLGAHIVPEAFLDDAQAVARENGLALPREALHQAIRPDPIGISRFQPAPVTLDHWPIRGWKPGRSAPTGAAPMIDWAWFGDRPLAEPLYQDSVMRNGSRPFSLMFRTRTSLPALVAGAEAGGAAVPDGLIFHMSRCGSTLAAQMLAAVPHHVVASEAEAIDAVVQWATLSDAAPEAQVAALRAIVGAVGRPYEARKGRYFIKLDSWHSRALPLFRRAFPDVPWIFLYREPVEVMASLMRLRGLQSLPGGLPPQILQIEDGEAMPGEDYCALALQRICSGVLDHRALGGGMFVNYTDIRQAMLHDVPRHFGFTPDSDELAAMSLAATRDAKAPDAAFVADSDRKRAEASSAVRNVVERHLRPVYERLQMLRQEVAR